MGMEDMYSSDVYDSHQLMLSLNLKCQTTCLARRYHQMQDGDLGWAIALLRLSSTLSSVKQLAANVRDLSTKSHRSWGSTLHGRFLGANYRPTGAGYVLSLLKENPPTVVLVEYELLLHLCIPLLA